MKILFIGGNGNISWSCSELALKNGHQVYVLNRGNSSFLRKELDKNIIHIKADIREVSVVKKRLMNLHFDVIVDFLCYSLEHAKRAVELFRDITSQYIFISSTANYSRFQTNIPLTEDTLFNNINWNYTQNKIAAENFFMMNYEKNRFPVTIVRPSHTYDCIIPDAVGYGDWTVLNRMIQGKTIILHGDGTNLWTLTHSKDFAEGITYLYGNLNAIGQAYHITSDEILTWRDILKIEANTLGVDALQVMCIPSIDIAKRDVRIGDTLIGHKMWSDVYDNSKIKAISPNWNAKILFANGINSTINWFKEEKERLVINKELDSFMDSIVNDFSSVCSINNIL